MTVRPEAIEAQGSGRSGGPGSGNVAVDLALPFLAAP